MKYQISEEQFADILTQVYRAGAKGEESPHAIIEAILRRHRSNLVNDEVSPSPVGYHWEVIMSPDMMAACDEGTYVQEMGVPPPVVIGPGPVGPYTPWRDINGTFRRRKYE